MYTYKIFQRLSEILNTEFIENPLISDQLIDDGLIEQQHWGFNHGHKFTVGRIREQSPEEIANRRIQMLGNKFGVGGPGSKGKTWRRSE